MPETHINALYADLTAAKQAAAIAHGKVAELEDQIRGRGGVVPGEEGPAPDVPAEDVVSSEDVSASESKPLSKLNRTELNAKAVEAGIENPEQFKTNAEVVNAIKGVK